MKSLSSQNLLIVTLAQSVFLASMGTSMANLALPAIGDSFAIDFSSARLVVLTYLLATTVSSLWIGRFADVHGRHVTLFLGIGLFVLAGLGAALSRSFPLLLIFRSFQGIGAAALVVLPIVIATETVASNRAGRVIGLLATMSAIGTASGPSLGGLLLASFGWRSLFFAMTGLSFLNFLFLLAAVRGVGEERRPQRVPRRLSEVLGFMIADADLRLNLIFNTGVSAVMMTTLIAGPYFLTRTLHISSTLVGLIMSVGPLTSIVSGALSGFFVDRFGPRTIMRAGFFQLLVGTAAFIILPRSFGGPGFAGSAMLLSVGYQLFLSANSTAVMKATTHERKGVVSGALALSRNLGLISGTSVLGAIFDLFGLQIVFGCAAVVISILLIAFSIKEQRSKNGPTFIAQIY